MTQHSFYKVNLEGAHLATADFTNQNCYKANLRGADLRHAIFNNTQLAFADLRGANLEGANFLGANLHGANLQDARFSANTLLPDATGWSPDTDMSSFTGGVAYIEKPHSRFLRLELYILRAFAVAVAFYVVLGWLSQ